MDGFLFKTKTGYCVHFATAMAMMLRSQGVPARLVSGFLDGEWNAYGRYLLVRQQDAHTWVDAWLPDRGWTAFDPTPAAERRDKNLFGGLTGVIDYLEYKWDRWVVFYSLRDQAGAARKVFSAFQSARTRLAEADRKLRFDMRLPGLKGKKALAILPMFIAIALAAALLGRAFLRKAAIRKNSRASVEFYEEAAAMLRRKGFSRRPGETPQEFADALAAGGRGLFGPFTYLTDAYNRVRFGGSRLSADEKRRVREALSSLKASLRTTAPGRRE